MHHNPDQTEAPTPPPAVIGYATPDSNRRRRPVPAARWLRVWRCHPVDIGIAWVVVAILLVVVDAGLQSEESFRPSYLGGAAIVLTVFFPVYLIMTPIICWEFDKPEDRN